MERQHTYLPETDESKEPAASKDCAHNCWNDAYENSQAKSAGKHEVADKNADTSNLVGNHDKTEEKSSASALPLRGDDMDRIMEKLKASETPYYPHLTPIYEKLGIQVPKNAAVIEQQMQEEEEEEEEEESRMRETTKSNPPSAGHPGWGS